LVASIGPRNRIDADPRLHSLAAQEGVMVIQIVYDHDNNGGRHNADQEATNLPMSAR
jgi:hypothetical protein